MSFKSVQKKIAKSEGVSMDRAGAILAAGARKASPAAVRANPKLARVSGVHAPGHTQHAAKVKADLAKHEGRKAAHRQHGY